MDQVILRVLAAEVQRRKCPGCGNSLRQADVDAGFSGDDKVQLHFRCRYCVFEGGGEIELTPEIYREAAISEAGVELSWEMTEPISDDEMIDVHTILADWSSDLRTLIQR